MSPDDFRALTRPLPEPMLMISEKGDILGANAAALHLLGLPGDRVENHSLRTFAADAWPKVLGYLESCSHSGQMTPGSLLLQKGESRIRCKCEGALLQRMSRMSPAILLLRLQEHGRSAAPFTELNRKIEQLAHEIHERRRTEEALRQSEQQFRALAEKLEQQKEWLKVTLESIGDAVIATGSKGEVVFMNPVAERLLGWPLEEAQNRPLEEVFRLVNENSCQRVEDPVSKVLRSQKTVALANHSALVSRSGKVIAIEDSAAPIRNDQQEIIGVILVFHDVTKRRESERRLTVYNQTVRILSDAESIEQAVPGVLKMFAQQLRWDFAAYWSVNSSEDLLLCRQTWSRPGRELNAFESVSRRCTFRKGAGVPGQAWDSGETLFVSNVRNKTDFFRIREASLEGLHSALAFPVYQGERMLGVLEFFSFREKQREEISFSTAAAVAGQLSQFLLRKQSEQKLRHHAQELEERVKERTFKLQETIRSLEAFCYSIAHDLRAPLRSIQSFAKILLEEYSPVLDEFGQDCTRRIMNAAARMDHLIQDLLTYGRLSHEELPLEPLFLEEAVQLALSSLEQEIKDKKARIEVEPSLGRIQANATVLEQVLANLISNALKFVSPGSTPHVRIRADHHQDHLRLWIEDNGIGIDPRFHERIFVVFERLHGVETYPGTGIGLAIVQKGIQRMGGQAGVQSSPGHGSAFWIQLPTAAP